MSEIFEVPLSNQNPAFTMNTTLDGVQFNFDYKYNTRTKLWMLNFSDRNDNSLVNSIPFFSGRELLKYTTAKNEVEGVLYIFASNETIGDADRFNFGLEVKKLYIGDS